MTEKEAISVLETAKAEVEWNCPLDYQTALDMAIDALKKQDRYNNELKENEKRLPKGLMLVLQDVTLSTSQRDSWLTFQATGDLEVINQVYNETHDSQGYVLSVCYKT